MAIAGKWHAHDAKVRKDNSVVVHGIGRGKSYLDHVGLEKPGTDRPSDKLLRERDARIAADTRTPQDILLGNPPPGRSALDQKTALPPMKDWLKQPKGMSAVTEPVERACVCTISVARYG
jgi:hypothetical protein